MRRLFMVAVLVFGTLVCGCQNDQQVAAYRGLLGQIRDNLASDIGPKYAAYIDADTLRPVELRDNDKALVTDTIDSIDRILTEAKKGAQ